MARHIKARFKSGRWELTLGRETFTVDAVVMQVASMHDQSATGVVLQSYGLDQAVAQKLDRDTLRDLGIGGPRNTHLMSRGFVGRAQLTTTGEVMFEP